LEGVVVVSLFCRGFSFGCSKKAALAAVFGAAGPFEMTAYQQGTTESNRFPLFCRGFSFGCSDKAALAAVFGAAGPFEMTALLEPTSRVQLCNRFPLFCRGFSFGCSKKAAQAAVCGAAGPFEMTALLEPISREQCAFIPPTPTFSLQRGVVFISPTLLLSLRPLFTWAHGRASRRQWILRFARFQLLFKTLMRFLLCNGREAEGGISSPCFPFVFVYTFNKDILPISE